MTVGEGGMGFAAKLSDAEVKVVATDVLGREMNDLAFERADVVSGLDYDDEPSLFIAAVTGPGIPGLDGARFGRIHSVLHEALLAHGEERFPYFRLRRIDDEALEDDLPTVFDDAG